MWKLLSKCFLLMLLGSLMRLSAGDTDRASRSQIVDGPIPHFFIIGAAKSGTTSLHALLVEHPELCKTEEKEAHFFDARWDSGLTYYQNFFRPKHDCKGGGKYFLDATPAYIRHSDFVPQRMAQTFSRDALAKKKFILILREPIAREYSWYYMMVRLCHRHLRRNMEEHGHLGHAFDEKVWHCSKLGVRGNVKETEVEDEDDFVGVMDKFRRYYNSGAFDITESMFDVQLNDWLKYVRRDQIFIISFVDLITKTPFIMERVQKFLGLKTGWGDDVVLPEDNMASGNGPLEPRLPCDIWDKMRAELVMADSYNKLYDIINDPHRHPTEPPFTPFDLSVRDCDPVTGYRKLLSAN